MGKSIARRTQKPFIGKKRTIKKEGLQCFKHHKRVRISWRGNQRPQPKEISKNSLLQHVYPIEKEKTCAKGKTLGRTKTASGLKGTKRRGKRRGEKTRGGIRKKKGRQVAFSSWSRERINGK